MSTLQKPWQAPLNTLTQALLVLCAFALPLSTSATDFLLPLAILASLFSEPLGMKWQKLRRHPLTFPLIAFFLVSVVGLFYTEAPWHDAKHRLLQMICFLFSAFLLVGVAEEKWRRRMLNAFLLAMVITLVLSYIKYYFFNNLFQVLVHDPMRIRFDKGTVFKDHIIQNFLMALVAVIFFYRWLHRYRFRWLYGLLALIATHNLLFVCNGRVGYIIFAALLLYIGLSYFTWRGVLSALAIIGVLYGAAFWASPEFKSRVHDIENDAETYHAGTGDNTSLGVRIQSMRNAYLLFKERPLFGFGTGSFATVYAALPSALTAGAGTVPISYNSYLNVAVEWGFLGLVSLLFLFVAQWRYSFALSGEWRYVMHITLIGMMLGCLANSWLTDTTELHFFALFISIGFSSLLPKHETAMQAQEIDSITHEART